MGAVGALLAAVYVFNVAPLEEKRAGLRENIAAMYGELLRYESYIKGDRVTPGELEAAKGELGDMEAGVIERSDESLAFAEFQIKVQEIAERTGISILSVRPLSSVEHASYKGLPLFIEGRAGIRQLGAFLKAIDTKDSYIKLESLNVLVPGRKAGRKLRIKMQLSGLMKR